MTQDVVAAPGDGDPLINQRIGDYQIERRLGGGATGTVYRARRLALDMPVAIKFLSSKLDDPTFKTRFAHEARSAASINHPNIVRVFDVGEHEGCPYLVAELVEGTSLGQMLSRQLILPVPEVVEICLQALAALTALEDAGLVHRDIKPDNIMLTKSRQVKLIDLGLVRHAHGATTQQELTQAGQILGTPAYMPPEQWMGGVIDHRADQYALGVTFYVAVTGSKPFAGATLLALLDAIRTGNPVPIHRINARVPEALSSVVMRMMHSDPNGRWPTARQCARAITEAWAANRQQDAPSGGSPSLRSPDPPAIPVPLGPPVIAGIPTPRPAIQQTPTRGTRILTQSQILAGPRPERPSAGGTSRIVKSGKTPSSGQPVVDPLPAAARLQREGRIDEALALLKLSQTQEGDPWRSRQIRAAISGLHRVSDDARMKEMRQRLVDARVVGDSASLRLEILRSRQALPMITSQEVRDAMLTELATAERQLARRLRIRWAGIILGLALLAALIAGLAAR